MLNKIKSFFKNNKYLMLVLLVLLAPLNASAVLVTGAVLATYFIGGVVFNSVVAVIGISVGVGISLYWNKDLLPSAIAGILELSPIQLDAFKVFIAEQSGVMSKALAGAQLSVFDSIFYNVITPLLMIALVLLFLIFNYAVIRAHVWLYELLKRIYQDGVLKTLHRLEDSAFGTIEKSIARNKMKGARTSQEREKIAAIENRSREKKKFVKEQREQDARESKDEESRRKEALRKRESNQE